MNTTEADDHMRTIGRLGFFPGRRVDETFSLSLAVHVAADDMDLKFKVRWNLADGFCFVDMAIAVSDRVGSFMQGQMARS